MADRLAEGLAFVDVGAHVVKHGLGGTGGQRGGGDLAVNRAGPIECFGRLTLAQQCVR